MTVVIANVAPSEARDAFHWYRGFAAANEHLFPHTWDKFQELANEYELVCARDGDHYVGFCYYTQDQDSWEIGGVMVAANQRGRALGSTLVFVTLGNLLIDVQPLTRGETVISYVHRDNNAPRSVITERLKFVYRRSVQVPAQELPGFTVGDDGLVHGDEFEWTRPGTLLALADWCDGWQDKLRDGSPARVELRDQLTLPEWAEAFRQMATNPDDNS